MMAVGEGQQESAGRERERGTHLYNKKLRTLLFAGTKFSEISDFPNFR